MRAFTLKKWYLDIADDAGNVFIGYCAALKWGKFELNGFQQLWRSAAKGVETQTEISRQPAPEYRGQNQLVWQPRGIDAVWESRDEPILETLLDCGEGKIVWRCTQPRASASLNSARLCFKGWGYTECIDITLPVWKLPFKTLYWGRCHTQNHCLVWIKWEGQTRQNLIWLDGRRSQEFTIEETRITGPDFRLELGANVPLRQGRIASTIFQPFWSILKVLPKAAFLADEHKWYNLGVLQTASGIEPAILIYEKVQW